MFATAYDTFIHHASHLVEKQEVKELRESLKVGIHTAKIIATAALTATVALALFGTLFGACVGSGFGTFWILSSLLLTAPVAIIAIDGIKASDKGYLLADNPKNFAIFNFHETVGKARVIQECHALVTEMLKNTCVLKHASHFILDRYVAAISEFLKRTNQ